MTGLLISVVFQQCLRLDPDERPTCSQLIKHDFFSKDNFTARFQNDLKQRIERENQGNPLKSGDKDDDESKSNKKKKKGDNNKEKVTLGLLPFLSGQ